MPSWCWVKFEKSVNNEDIDQEILDYVSRSSGIKPILVRYSGLDQCIHTVRSVDMRQDDLEDVRVLESDDPDREQEAAFVITRHMYKSKMTQNIFASKSQVNSNEIESSILCSEFDFTSKKIVTQTTSQTKLDYVLSEIGIVRDFPFNMTILCCAEGYGGFVEYISFITSNSVFVFNTLPPRHGKNCFPYSAYKSF